MSQQFDTGTRPFTADAAIPQFARVIFESDGRIVAAGLTDPGIGVAQLPAFAAGDVIPVRLYNITFKMRASEALAVGALLYTETDGEVQDTAQATSVPFAQALESATADGDIIEVVLLPYRGAAAG